MNGDKWLGFITRDGGISSVDWSEESEKFEFVKSTIYQRKGLNPFTGKETEFAPGTAYWIEENNTKIGGLQWVQDESIVVTGDEQKLKPYIKVLCDELNAIYEKVES